MSEKKLPELPEELEEYLDKPYGGLFGNTVLARVVEEIVADPTMDYRPGYLEEMTGKKAPSIREALRVLVRLGLIENVSSDVQHPVYRVVVESKKFIALSLLAYAMLDDRDGTDCMNTAILDYYNRSLRAKAEPLAVATNYAGEWTTGEDCSAREAESKYSIFSVGEEQNETKDGAAGVDLRKLYRFEPEELQLDITHSSYSNLAYVQVTHRDACIDFLEMPGVRREGRTLINGTRVYMSHAAAQKLAEALSGILERVHTEEGMERYVPGGLERRRSSTKVERKQEDRPV